MQAVSERIEKHFEFTTNGLLIKAGEGTMNLILDNDLIRFVKNGQQFGWWDGVNFHTGNIEVEVNERAQFGNFAFVPRSNGSLSFLKVTGENIAQRTLLAISATYRGGSVPAGTSLSSLTNITVTATYSDNSTEAVDNYSLSGVINAGTNTITVSYGGKVTSFTVVGEALPNELVSISATYSGGSVPVGTSVESLSGIEVTGHWSDGSTSIVSGASISGTINEGENIITLTYQGKTATITVVGEGSSSEGPADEGTTLDSMITNVVVAMWLSNVTTGASITYAGSVRAVDGNVELVDAKTHTVYMDYAGIANDYTVLLGKYVKVTGGVYYIHPDSTYSHNLNVTQVVKENIVYHKAQKVNAAA